MAILYRGVYTFGKVPPDGGISILSYHSLDNLGTPLSVSPRLFEAQMAALATEGCVAFTMAQVAAQLAAHSPFPPRAVAITFDDGFANLATEGAPILAEYGLVATVYIINSMVGRVTQWTDRGAALPSLPLLGWKQIEALQGAGIEIGAHSLTHGFLTRYSPIALQAQVHDSRLGLERKLGAPVGSFAYPQGDYNRRVVAATRAAGYKSAVTVDQGRAGLRSDPFRLPRFLVSGNAGPEAIRAFTVPAIGPTYRLINWTIKNLLGRKGWPRRKPGEIQSTQSLPAPT